MIDDYSGLQKAAIYSNRYGCFISANVNGYDDASTDNHLDAV